MEFRFSILDLDVTLAGPSDVVRSLAAAYGRFAVDKAHGSHPDIEIRLEGEDSVRIDGRSVPLVPGIERDVQLHQHLHRRLMDSIDRFAVLHAAALVDPRGGAVVIGAPSGHGKSSLALELASRGFRFLSDDFAPLDLEGRTVEPFPRAVGVIAEDNSALPEAFRAAAGADDAKRLFDKRLLDVGDVLGESRMANAAAPLGNVILIGGSGADWPPRYTVMKLACAASAVDVLESLFDRTDGVDVVVRVTRNGFVAWTIRLDHRKRPTETLAPILDSEHVVIIDVRWEQRPDFSAVPHATRISRREAAMTLAREMLNRGVRGRLRARFGGDAARMFLALAGALREAECYRIEPGDCGATAGMIEEIVAAEPVAASRAAKPPSPERSARQPAANPEEKPS